MALLKIFPKPKHQQYKYIPRYWDPKKEDLDKRLAQARGEQANDAESVKSRIRGGFARRGRYDHVSRKKAMMRSNLILLAAIIILLVLSYIFIVQYLPEISNAFE